MRYFLISVCCWDECHNHKEQRREMGLFPLSGYSPSLGEVRKGTQEGAQSRKHGGTLLDG